MKEEIWRKIQSKSRMNSSEIVKYAKIGRQTFKIGIEGSFQTVTPINNLNIDLNYFCSLIANLSLNLKDHERRDCATKNAHDS